MRPVRAKPPAVERIQDRAVDPACELEPEVHEEQRELDAAHRHHRLQVVGADQQHQRDADDERHLEHRQHHRQRLAHHVHRRKEAQRTDGQTQVARAARDDVRQRLVDLAAVVGVDGALVHLLLPRRDHGADYRVIDLALRQEAHPAPDASQQVRVDLCQQPAAQSLAAIGPPLPAGWIAAAAVHLCQTRIAGRVVGPGRAWGLGAIGVIEAGRVEEVTRPDPGDVVHLLVGERRPVHEQLGARRPVAVVREVGDLLCQHRIVDARGIHIHADLTQVRAAGNRRYRGARHGFRQRVHEEPPHRHQRALVVERRVDVGPARVVGQRDVDLALRGARGVEPDRGEIHRDEWDAGEHDDHDRHPHPVLDAHRRQHALVAFVRTFAAGLEPFLDHDGHERKSEHPAGHEDAPDAVVDHPSHQGQVILQVVRGVERHACLPVSAVPQQLAGFQRDHGDHRCDLRAQQALMRLA